MKWPEKQAGLRMRPLAHFQPVVQRKQLEYNFHWGVRQGSSVSFGEPELVIASHGLKLSHVSESPGGLVERQISEPYPGLPFFKLILIGAQLLYSVILVSTMQQ